MSNLSILTLNCQGLGNCDKRARLLQYVKQQNAKIVFLILLTLIFKI